jgi:acetylornithine deacetylase
MATTQPASALWTTTALLDRLVAFDTTSRNSNLPLIRFVRDYLDSCGVPYRVSSDPAGQKANLHAIIGPANVRRGGIERPRRHGAG